MSSSPANPPPAASRPAGQWFTILLVLASAALAVLCVLLARQNLQLKEQLAAATIGVHQGTTPAEEPGLRAGDRLEALALLDQAGNPVNIAFGNDHPPTLLLIFNTDCEVCEEVVPAWNRIAHDHLPAGSVRVVGVLVDADSTPDIAVLEQLPFEPHVATPDALRALQGITRVPASVLLEGSGTVRDLHYGKLSPGEEAALATKAASLP